MKRARILGVQAIVCLLPLIYLLCVWAKLPDVVPMHYNGDNVADRFGSKNELVAMMAVMAAIAIGVSLLILNIHRLDPKRAYDSNSSLMIKISWALTIFMSLLSFFIVYQTVRYTESKTGEFSPKIIMICVCLLLAVIGNLMNSVKPNYFVGIRTPWALEDPENWRLTHRLSARLWLGGGLAMAVFVLIAPDNVGHIIMLVGILPLIVIPFAYSYRLFRKGTAKQKQ